MMQELVETVAQQLVVVMVLRLEKVMDSSKVELRPMATTPNPPMNDWMVIHVVLDV
jgi:hypothetical protein